MTGQHVLDMLMARLGNRTEAALRANVLLEMIQFQAITMEKGPYLPFFLLVNEEPLTVTADVRAVALPSDFLRELEEDSLFILDDNSVPQPMVKGSYDELAAHHGLDADSTLPLDYCIRGTDILLFPKSSVARTLQLSYFASDAVPADTTTENLWLKYASDLLLAGTGEIVAGQYLQNSELSVIFAGQKMAAQDRLVRDDTARQEAARSREMG